MSDVAVELVERLDVAQAQARYELSRAGLNNRLAAVRDALGLETVKEGGKGWITGELLEVMDGLHAHKERGGTQEEFLAARVREQSGGGMVALERSQPTAAATVAAAKLKNASDPQQAAQGLALVVEAVAERVAERLVPRDPLANLRALKEASEEGWILSSSQVGELLGVVPKGKEFERHGFTFEQVGKVGAQSGWRVRKRVEEKPHKSRK